MFQLIVYFATRPSEAPDDTLPNVTVSITTWNILAPMWTDREYLARRGIVDLNLLDENIRLMLIAGRMKTQRADILHLQEVRRIVAVSLSSCMLEPLKANMSDLPGREIRSHILPANTNQ